MTQNSLHGLDGTALQQGHTPSIQHVDQLVLNTHTDIGDARVTSVAQQVLNYDPEAMIWQDAPSLACMLSNVLKWAILFAVWLAALSYLAPAPVVSLPAPDVVAEAKPVKKGAAARNAKARAAEAAAAQAADNAALAKQASDRAAIRFWTLVLGVLVFVLKFFGMIKRALQLRSIRYSMTSQRLKIESGIFSKTSNVYELHALGSGQVHMPFFMRMFGRSNLYVSGLWLVGIKNAEAVRDLIRNAGQIEASRVDKARFR